MTPYMLPLPLPLMLSAVSMKGEYWFTKYRLSAELLSLIQGYTNLPHSTKLISFTGYKSLLEHSPVTAVNTINVSLLRLGFPSCYSPLFN